MSRMQNLIKEMQWLNEPKWEFRENALTVFTMPDTDYWQRTHYGFRRDNGHALVKEVRGGVTVRCRFQFSPNAQYDQCGVILRVDENNWFKCSAEYENASESRLGSVLTRAGYSDWATQDISSDVRQIWYEVAYKHSDIFANYSFDGNAFKQMRIGHLDSNASPILAGIYGCSPLGKGFQFTAADLTIVCDE